LIEDDKDTI
jgi:hypothetical protein